MKHSMLFGAIAAVLVIASAADAKPCRDAKGHFIKCPPPAAAVSAPAKGKKCRDAKGHFAKCGTPGAK